MRKKFTMLLMLMLAAFTSSVMAQTTCYRPGARTTTLEAGKQYFISAATFYNNGRPNLLYNNGGTLAYSDKKPNALIVDETYLFTVEKIGENNIYYITNSDGKYLQSNSLASVEAETGITVVPYSSVKGSITCGNDVQACDESGNRIEYNNITAATPIVCVYQNNSTGWRHISGLEIGKSTPFAFYEAVKVLPEVTTDENNPKWYTIKNVRGNAYAYYNGTSTAMGMSGMVDKAAYLFYFTEGTAEGTYRIHNYVNSKLCAAPNSWTDEGIDWYIKISGNTNYPGLAIAKQETLTDDWTVNEAWNDSGNLHTSVAWYGGNDAGSTWQITPYEFDGILPTIQLSTADNIVLHYIRSQRRTNFVNFDGHNTVFKEGDAGLSSYWYFVQDEEAQKNAPAGFVACRIFNAAYETGVENHSSGYMGDDSWPARIYYIGTGEHNRNGYLIYRSDANLDNNGYGCWHDNAGGSIMDYHKNDDGSYWRIYPSGTTSADLMQQAATAKNNALNTIATFESADYYAYSAENIAQAKTDVNNVNTDNLAEAVSAMLSTTFSQALTTLEATEKSGAPVAGDYIQLKNKHHNQYLKALESDAEGVDSKADLATVWAVKEGSGGNVKLQNVSTGKYIGRIRKSATVAMTDEANAAEFSWTNQDKVYAVFKDVNTDGVADDELNYLYGHVNGGKLVGWVPDAGSTQWLVSKAYPLTIVYMYNGAEIAEHKVETCLSKGDTYTINTNPYATTKEYLTFGTCTATGSQPVEVDGTWSVKVTEATSITVTLVDELPFEYAADVENISDWYYLKFHASDRNYLYYETIGEVLKADVTAVDANNKDAYTWAFVGDPIAGFKLYNKAAEKYLDAVEAGAVVSDAEQQVFKLTKSSYAVNGFFMQAKDGDHTQRFNKQEGKVVYWSGANAGSTFMVELRPKEGLAAVTELLEANASNHSAIPALGQYPTVAYEALQAACDAPEATTESIEVAIAAFKASLNRPAYIITSAWDAGYPAGSAIYYDGAWKWKKASRYDRQMWMTIPGYTNADVPTVSSFDVNNPSYGFCDYSTGTKMRDQDVQIVAVPNWPEAYNLQYSTDYDYNDAAMHAQSGGALVGWLPAALNDCQPSAWRVEYIGNTYDLDQLTEPKLEALANLQAAFDSKVYLFDAVFGAGIGKYQGAESAIKELLFEVSGVLARKLGILKELSVDQIESYTKSLNGIAATINLPEDGKYYRIFGANSNVSPAGRYITNHTNGDGGRIAVTEEADASTVYYYKDGKLQAHLGGKFIGVSINPDNYKFADSKDAASDITFAASSYVAGAYTIYSADCYLRYKVHNGEAEVDRGESEESANDAWYLQEVTKHTITYIYKNGKTELARQNVEGFIGFPYPAADATLPLGYVAPTTLEGTVSVDDTEKVIACAFDKSKMPFQYADSYENIEHWYYLNIADNGYYLYHADDPDYIALNKTAVDANNKDAYSWAFIGNPTDGFQIVNRAKGEGWILSSSTTMSGDNGGGTYPIMTELANLPGGNNTHWIHSKSTNRANRDGFYLAQKGNANNRLNNRSSKLAYWTGGADAGSTLVAVEQYEMTQLYSGVGSWEVSPVYPAGLKTGAASGSHGNAAGHVGANGHTIYKSTKAIVTTEADVTVSFNYAGGNQHGLISLGVDVVNGNGDVVASDYHVGFTGGAQDNKLYTLRNLPAGNYILRCYVCDKNADHELSKTGGNIVVTYAKELTDVNAASAMWTTLNEKAQTVIAYKGEGLGYYNNADAVEEKAAATPENTVAGYTAAFVALDDAIDNAFFALPEAGKFYRIKNNGGTGYLNGNGTSGRAKFDGGENDANSVFYYVGGKLLSYKTGTYLAAKIPSGKNANFLCYTEELNVGTDITFKESPALGKLLIVFDNESRSFYSASTGESDAAGAGNTGDNYRFTVEEVTTLPVTITAAQVSIEGETKCISTFYAPVALDVPAGEGVIACTGQVVDNYLALTAIESNVIPANTGVILLATADDESVTYNFSIYNGEVSGFSEEDNHIKGSVAKTLVAPENGYNCYVLAKKNEKVGLYRASLNKNNNTAFLNNACKAYIPVRKPTVEEPEQQARALTMRFTRGGDEGTTDLEKSEIRNEKSEMIFDLAGRRIPAIVEKGVYIVNGKKVVIR